MKNIFSDVPTNLPSEIFEDIISTEAMRIERIISDGHITPNNQWYDQVEHEWVMVLSGYGVIAFEDGRQVTLKQGDYINIPAHQKHRVIETAMDTKTVWLAIFYR